jgi:hypothetical protein
MKAKYHGTCPYCRKPIHVGDEITFKLGITSHASCKPFMEPEGSFWISEGQGYGGMPFVVGKVLHNPDAELHADVPKYIRVLHAEQRYYRDDGMSLGVGAESGYVYRACVRAATEDESKELREHDALEAEARGIAERLRQLTDQIRTHEHVVAHDTPFPDGEQYFDIQHISGSGSVYVVTNTGVWYLERHMMDGDDWLANNVAGTHIGWFLADATVGDEVRWLAKEFKRIQERLHRTAP